MSGTQHLLRSFIEERLTAAAVEIFGVVEKTISEYEEQVVQSKRELEQLRQDITHLNTLRPSIQLYRTDSQPVSEKRLPLQQLNPRQELMSSQEDDTGDSHLVPPHSTSTVGVQHSTRVKEERMDLCIVPDSVVSCSSNIVTRGSVKRSQSTIDSQPILPCTTVTAVQQSPQVKEEQPELSFIQHSETSVHNSETNGFFTLESTTSDSHLIPSYGNGNETVQHQCPQVKEEQLDFIVASDSESSISNSGTDGFDTSESSSDSHPIPSYTMATLIASHDVTNKPDQSDGAVLTFSHRDDYVFCAEQKVCRFCRKQCCSYNDLVQHVEQNHPGQKAFKCPECDKEFARRNNFADHFRIHTGAERHSCHICGKVFTHRSNLNFHVKKAHSGVGRHPCPVDGSGETFGDRSALKLHMRIHTDHKPYSCPFCGRLFAQNANLKSHMRVHMGEEPCLIGSPQQTSEKV